MTTIELGDRIKILHTSMEIFDEKVYEVQDFISNIGATKIQIVLTEIPKEDYAK